MAHTQTSAGIKNIVIVHGAFADASGWQGVFEILKKRGYQVTLVQNPLTSLEDDVEATNRVLDRQDGPVVLVGHSWGGSVITQAGSHPKVAALVYIAAFVPAAGESTLDLIKTAQPAPENGILPPDEKGFIWYDKQKFKAGFCADVSTELADFMYSSQVPVSVKSFLTPLTAAAWESKPSYGVVSIDDKSINPAIERNGYHRAKSIIVEVKASHAVYMSKPKEVASVIERAATTSNKNGAASLNAAPATPNQLVDALHAAFGDHHSRAVHAKGIILEGNFTPAPGASTLTDAFHFQNETSSVIVRFSDFTGIPTIPDNAGAANPRGMAIKFKMNDGRTTDLVTHSFNGFPTQTQDQFRQLLLAISTSGPGAAKPSDLDRFLDSHPVARTFLTTQKNPASYGSINYFGVNSFKFTNAAGSSHFIRYQLISESGESLLTADELAQKDAEFLQTEIRTRIAGGPITFKMYAQIAEPADKIADPSIAWPENRKRVLLGTIRIEKLAANSVIEDKALSYSPNNIPNGIETADPMLDFRTRTYPLSVKGRQ